MVDGLSHTGLGISFGDVADMTDLSSWMCIYREDLSSRFVVSLSLSLSLSLGLSISLSLKQQLYRNTIPKEMR